MATPIYLLLLATATVLRAAPVQPNNATTALLSVYYDFLAADILPPSRLDFSIIDRLVYYAVAPDDEGLLQFNDSIANELVSAAHVNGKLAGFTVGGPQGSDALPELTTKVPLRTAFATNIISAAREYDFDFAEIDFEFPADEQQAQGLVMLYQEIRHQLPSAQVNLSLGTTLGSTGPGAPGLIMQLSDSVDWGTILAYEFVNISTTNSTGAIAPLSQCGDTASNGTVRWSVGSWLLAGFAPSKLVLGAVALGYNFSHVLGPIGTSTHGSELVQPFQNPSMDGFAITELRTMVDEGVLASDIEAGAGSYRRYWDNCTQTPFLYSAADSRIIAYEDPLSISIKVQYALDQGLAGMSILSGNFDAPGMLLTKAAYLAMNDPDETDTLGLFWALTVLCFLLCICAILRIQCRRWRQTSRDGKMCRPKMSDTKALAVGGPVELQTVSVTIAREPDVHRYSTFTISSPAPSSKCDTTFTINEEQPAWESEPESRVDAALPEARQDETRFDTRQSPKPRLGAANDIL